MSTFEIKLDTKAVTDALGELQRRAANPRKLMASVSNELNSISEDAFSKQQSPDGTGWKEWSSVTQHLRSLKAAGGRQYGKNGKELVKYTREGKGGRLLFQEGSLLRTLGHSHTDTTATVQAGGGGVSYAAIHQFGGKAGRGKKVDIPARPYLPITKNGELMKVAERSILGICRDHFQL